MNGPPPPAATPPAATIEIKRIGITGVDAATARCIGPAIESAIAAALNGGGTVRPDVDKRLSLSLQHGAGEREIVAALLHALGLD